MRQKEKATRLSRLNHGLYRHQELRGLTPLEEVWHADACVSIKCLITIIYGNNWDIIGYRILDSSVVLKADNQRMGLSG